jgi:hypothetical protein
MSEQPFSDPAFPRKLIIAALLESALIIAGLAAFFVTEQIGWIIAAGVIGGLGMGLWLLKQARRPAKSSIVEGGPR